jgi:hypothetical protein
LNYGSFEQPEDLHGASAMPIVRFVVTAAAAGFAFLAGLYYSGVFSHPMAEPRQPPVFSGKTQPRPVEPITPVETAEADALSKFVGPEGDFSVWFPEPPEAAPTAVTDGIVRGQQYSSRSDGRTYLVARCELKQRERNNEKFLEGMAKGMTKHGTKPVPTQRIALGPHSGVEVAFENAQGLHVRGRAYLAGDRAFMVIAMAKTKDDLQDLEVETFLASFEIVEP